MQDTINATGFWRRCNAGLYERFASAPHTVLGRDVVQENVHLARARSTRKDFLAIMVHHMTRGGPAANRKKPRKAVAPMVLRHQPRQQQYSCNNGLLMLSRECSILHFSVYLKFLPGVVHAPNCEYRETL